MKRPPEARQGSTAYRRCRTPAGSGDLGDGPCRPDNGHACPAICSANDLGCGWGGWSHYVAIGEGVRATAMVLTDQRQVNNAP